MKHVCQYSAHTSSLHKMSVNTFNDLSCLVMFEHTRSWHVVDKTVRRLAHKQEVEIYWWLLFFLLQPVWLDWEHYFFFADLNLF